MNREFENVNRMQKRKIFDIYHVYFIDSYSTEFNDIKLTHLYVADKTVRIDEYTKLKIVTDEYLVFEVDYGDGVPRAFKAYPSKDQALIALEKMKGGNV